jgi:hypothetical protein
MLVNCFQFCLQFMPSYSLIRLCQDLPRKQCTEPIVGAMSVLPEGVSAKQWSVQLVKHAIAHSLHSLPIQSIKILYNSFMCFFRGAAENPYILLGFLKHLII